MPGARTGEQIKDNKGTKLNCDNIDSIGSNEKDVALRRTAWQHERKRAACRGDTSLFSVSIGGKTSRRIHYQCDVSVNLHG